nr:gamma-glutamyltransferase [Cryobacterium sp. Y57]
MKDGQTVAALGSTGGDQQDQWQCCICCARSSAGALRSRRSMRPPFTAPRFRGSFWPRTGEPGSAVVEDRLGETVIAEREGRGYRITQAGDGALGRISAVNREPRSRLLQAAADAPGTQGYAAGR